MTVGDQTGLDFRAYFEHAEPRLRNALVAGFGPDDGREAAAEALAWGWRNWDRLQTMDNPNGYLYRIGRNRVLRQRARERGRVDVRTLDDLPDRWQYPEFEPGLAGFLELLPRQQRTCVWLVHGLGYTLADVAGMLGCSRSTVAAHVRRALMVLRSDLEVPSES